MSGKYVFLDGALSADLANPSDVARGDALVAVRQEDTGAIAQTLHIWIKAARRRLVEAGFVADGLTATAAANSVALNQAMAWLRDRGGGILELPIGTGYFSSDIVALINGTTSRFFAIEGQGMEACRLLSTNGSKLKIYADTPPARANAFVDLVLEGFEITNASGSKVNAGIDIYSMQRSRISGVRSTGWNYGTRIRSSWNNTVDQRCQFDGNNVGIKIPRASSGANLNEGFNTTDIRGISCANNVKAGISIALGNVITISNVLLESNPVGIYLMEAAKKVTLSDLYYEKGAITLTETNRAGTLAPFLLYCGKDEDGVSGDTAQPVKQIDISQPMRNAGEGLIKIENVDGVYLPNDEEGRSYVWMGSNVRNVRLNGISGDNTTSTPLVENKGRAVSRNVLRDFGHNWIANGGFYYTGLPYYVLTGAGATAALSSKTLDGSGAKTFDISCPNGVFTITARFDIVVPANSEYCAQNNLILASLHGLASSADFASVKIELIDNIGTTLASNTKSSGLTSWHVISCEAGMNSAHTPVTSISVKVTLTRTTAVGAETYSLEEIVCGDVNRAQLMALSPSDMEVGLSGTVTCSTASGAWRYTDVTTPFTAPEHYDAQLTAQYDGAQTDTMVQAEKLAGGGTLRVWSNKNGAVVSYRLVPRVLVLP